MRAVYTDNFETAFDASEAARSRALVPLVYAAILIPFGLNIGQALAKHDPDWAKPIAFMLPVLALFIFLFGTRLGRKFWMRLLYGKLLRKQYGQVSWSFEDHSIKCETSHGTQSTYPWDFFKKVEEKPAGALVRTDVGLSFWFPRSAFAGQDGLADFLSLCERHNIVCVPLK